MAQPWKQVCRDWMAEETQLDALYKTSLTVDIIPLVLVTVPLQQEIGLKETLHPSCRKVKDKKKCQLPLCNYLV